MIHDIELHELPVAVPGVTLRPAYAYDKYVERWTRRRDMRVILPLLRWAEPEAVLEIGTAYGDFTAVLRHEAPQNCIVTSVGITTEHEYEGTEGQRGEVPTTYNFGARAESLDGCIVKLVRGSTNDPETWKKLPQNIDFAFIDGDHSKAGVIRDTQLVFERMEKRGVIVWHDANKDNCGVDEALEFVNADVYRVRDTWVAFTVIE